MNSFTFKNDRKESVCIFLEPEGTCLGMSPGQEITIVLEGEEECFQMGWNEDGDLSIWPTRGDYQVIVDGKLIRP